MEYAYQSGSSSADLLSEPRMDDYTASSREGIIDSFRPDPSRRFYKLDQNLLWAKELSPVQRLVLIDFFHRYSARLRIPSIAERADLLGIDGRTLRRAESDLVEIGCLLRRETPGKVHVYLACFPPVARPREGEPEPKEWAQFLEAFRRLCELSDQPRREDKMSGVREDKMSGAGRTKCPGSTGAYTTPPLKMDEDPPTPDVAIATEGFSAAPPPPPPKKKTRQGGKPDAAEEAWLSFLAVYPPREGDLNRQPGRMRFRSLLRSGEKAATILEGVRRFRTYCDRQGKTGGPYVPMISTWLGQRRWEGDWSTCAAGNGSSEHNEKKAAILAALKARRAAAG